MKSKGVVEGRKGMLDILFKEKKVKDNEMGIIEQLKKDFWDFKEGCMGLLLFGSYAEGGQTKRSDIDVCIVNKKVS